MVELVWLIPALPLAGFLILVVGGRRMGEPAAGWLATVMVGGAFAAAVVTFLGLTGMAEPLFAETLFTWIPAGDFSVDVGVYLDPLSGTMMLFITGVAALIHLYSIGYMHGDPNFTKFFVYLNLFVFSMLVLVLGDNLLLTFLGWEGVGACSYFLISFWFTKDANASAGKKAFVTNRIGDWGFMVAMLATFLVFGSLSYGDILPVAPGLAVGTASFIAVMLFVGAVGKSAQIPLFVWLPDAMAGPTPVSALIHAATMVTAGVYLMCRINPILGASADWVPELIGWVGAITAFVAATIATSQHDIKKVLAYSTVSQLGYMFLAVGVGAYWVAIFHMITHAFFKALLFLGAGSTIHGMHENQDLRVMGRLRPLLPITAGTFIVGWLAIAGVPPFSGFWSKDEILAYAFQENIALYVIGLVAALITAYYMGREVWLAFFTDQRRWEGIAASTDDGEHPSDELQTERAGALGVPAHEFHPLPKGFTPHESPWTMTVPLVVLAVAAAVGGILNLPFPKSAHFLETWLEPVFALGDPTELTLSTGAIVALLGVSTVFALAGVAISWALFQRKPAEINAYEPAILEHGYFYDESIAAFVGGPGTAGFEGAAAFDRTVVDGAVNGTGGLTRRLGLSLRRAQDGYLRRYALALALGSLVVVGFMVARVVA